ncbi:MAG: glycosyltransferase family 4 protein [Candidatus Azobacteroides sp.]|nr:glycosyltransferase family 4 protein [Candidatus Azobacteroides sp.]
MRILFLPNWTVVQSNTNISDLQSPDKYIYGKPYWFFKYFSEDTQVDVIDIQAQSPLHGIEKKIKFYILQAVMAFKKSRQYDVVISHGAQSGLVYAFLNLFRKKERRTLHIIIDIGAMNGGRNNWIETFVIKWALRSHPAIIYHASIQQKYYEMIYKGLIKQSRFIPFGVNTEEFYPLGLPPEDYVLSFGYSKRDYPTLLDAWQKIDPSVRLYIIGDTSIPSINNIVSLPKSSISVLKQYIAKSLFVVIPLPVFNYSYGQMSFLQSMAMGKPVIVTKTPSSIDYLQNAQGAFLINPYDKTDMKNKIEYLLAHKEQLNDLGEKARKDIETGHFDEQTMAERMNEFIKTLL